MNLLAHKLLFWSKLKVWQNHQKKSIQAKESKMSPLKKGGLTRLVTPGSPSKGQPNNNPFSLFVIPMNQGLSTAYATTYNNPQR